MTELDIDPVEAFERSVSKSPDNTAEVRLIGVEQFLEWYDGDLSKINWLDVEEYVTHLFEEKGYASATVESRHSSLNQFCQFLEDKVDVLEENPVENADPLSDWAEYTTETKKSEALGPDDEVPSITPEEKEILCDNVPSPKLRNELMIRMLWQTGLREHELRKIKLDHVDRENRRLEVYGDKDEDHDRIVGYQPSLDVLLDQWINGGYRDSFATARDSENLFITHIKGEMIKGTVTRMIDKAAQSGGIQEVLYVDAQGHERKKITAHTLRHSFAVQSLKNGMDIHYVKELLGHEDVEITDSTYLQSPVEDNLDALRKHGAGTEKGAAD